MFHDFREEELSCSHYKSVEANATGTWKMCTPGAWFTGLIYNKCISSGQHGFREDVLKSVSY